MAARTPALVVALLFLAAADAAAQITTSPLVTGERVSLPSAILGEDRELLVALPDGYAESRDTYPLLLLLDAETHFHNAAGLVRFLSHRWVDRIPPMIVVGIVNTDRLRDVTPTATERFPDVGGVQPFLDFLEREVLPYVTATYRTDGRSVLAGHSGSGLAVLFGIFRFGDRFDAYVARDPSLDWDGGLTVREFDEYLARTAELPVYLTFGSYKPKPETGHMVAAIERRAIPGLRWSAPIYAGETHNSMVHRALGDALVEAFTATGGSP